MNLTKDKHNIVICGSEADAMSVYQSTGVPAVSLPRGITTLPQEVCGWARTKNPPMKSL